MAAARQRLPVFLASHAFGEIDRLRVNRHLRDLEFATFDDVYLVDGFAFFLHNAVLDDADHLGALYQLPDAIFDEAAKKEHFADESDAASLLQLEDFFDRVLIIGGSYNKHMCPFERSDFAKGWSFVLHGVLAEAGAGLQSGEIDEPWVKKLEWRLEHVAVAVDFMFVDSEPLLRILFFFAIGLAGLDLEALLLPIS